LSRVLQAGVKGLFMYLLPPPHFLYALV